MKTPFKSIFLSAAAAALTFTSTQAFESDPFGYVSYTLNANSDLKVGIPMRESSSFSSVVSSVSNGVVTFSGNVPDLTTDAHYLLVTSDNGLQGTWYTITAASGSDITVAEDLQALGLTSSDTVSAVKFWTLDSLFPEGGGIPQSSDPFSPVAQVLLNDPTDIGVNLTPDSSFIYYDGSAGGDAGWYDSNDLGAGLAGATVLNPETFMIIRNQTGASESIVISGEVPTTPLATSVLSRSAGSQDSQIYNPYPTSITLANSGLESSGAIRQSPDPFSPLDQLLVFDINDSGINTTPVSAYFYYDGIAGGDAGWYDVNDLGAGLQNTTELPAGGSFLIRRSSGSDELISWIPSMPYSL